MKKLKLGIAVACVLSIFSCWALAGTAVAAFTTVNGDLLGEISGLYPGATILRVDDDLDQIWLPADSSISIEAVNGGYSYPAFGYQEVGGSGLTDLFTRINGSSPGSSTTFTPANNFSWFLETDFFTWSSMETDNADGIDHMVTFEVDSGSDIFYVIAWEDLNADNPSDQEYQFDGDYRDVIFEVHGASPVPIPAGILLLGSGLLGLGIIRKKS